MDSTAIKALRALEWLCHRETPTGVTEMSVELGLAKSNAHRILTTLGSLGFVRSLSDGRYEATLKTWEMGSAVLARLDVKDVARSVMTALSKKTGETVHLSVLDELGVVYIDKVESSQPVRAYSRVGGRAPAYAVATGKVLLAHQEDVDKSLPKKFEAFTTHTVRSRSEFLKELEAVRRRGYAINRGEWRDGVCGVAAIIMNSRSEVVAAIGISGPGIRLGPEQLRAWAPSVIASAEEISRQLGWRPAEKLSVAAR